ncbi:hypothetical protein MUK42_28104 [Musa troglodytarum]|uniref:Receptor kinase-like protein Xa21 n=1 Tax=Musa troglodytarum TaxID=320322 RepID=A0A9E7JLH8_9LILI|nr:hypothetical protein MUK42_28104 [Musa troglodytarum]
MKHSSVFSSSLLLLLHDLILLLCVVSVPLPSMADGAADRLALESFKSMVSDPLGALASWNRTNPVCRWQGVSCGRRHPDRVTALRLLSSGLVGRIPPHVANLTFLQVLRLRDNSFHGQIPPELDRLSRLQALDLSLNYLDGPIPATLTRCSNLRQVSVRSNLLTGEIPGDVGLLSKMLVFNLGQNNLTGSIPPSLGNMTSLIALFLQSNTLEGSIPESIGDLKSLQLLQIAYNRLSGAIPSSVYNLSSISVFSVGNNLLEGTLPANMFDTLPTLEMLLMNNNHFHGHIPASLSNASYMGDIELSVNYFTGTVPSHLENLRRLYFVNLSDNQLEATDSSDWEFLASLTNCSLLHALVLDTNNFGGRLPTSLANFSSSLNIITLGSNHISGTIPTGIGNLFNLTTLSLSDNHLTGLIPPTIGGLRNLHALGLSGNRLTGQIPHSIGNLTELNRIYLQDNDLGGKIPESIGNCRRVEEMDLSHNKLGGQIPMQLFSISSLSTYLNLSNNLLNGTLPLQVGNLRNLGALVLAHNKLSGDIPTTLGQCQSLEYLYLHDNSFQGSVPQSLSSLRGLSELDLSSNNISGNIPEFLADLHALQRLNLSYNDLEGDVPNDGVFRNITAFSFIGNHKLCGGNQGLHLPPCHIHSGRKHESLALRVVIPVISVVVCAVILLIALAVLHRTKNLKKKNSFTDSIKEQFKRISYNELLRATDEFSASNLIGMGSFGSVYRGIINADGTTVAVKVLNLERHGASQSFISECEALRSIRHRNLVKILTICSSVDNRGNDFKALVLNYMSNGSLENWLHPKESEATTRRKLTLTQRLSIAIDVSSALDYLHHHGPMPIVHCDLKPSNVLLDQEMCAHVGDFGLARFLQGTMPDTDQNSTTSTGIKGTIGYVAPEYAMGGKVSTKGDIYSYGILLLELLTGKRPTEDMFKDGLSLHKYVEMIPTEDLLMVLDPSLLLVENGQPGEQNVVYIDVDRLEVQKCFVSAVKVGLACSKENPRERMQMGDVIKELSSFVILTTMDMPVSAKTSGCKPGIPPVSAPQQAESSSSSSQTRVFNWLPTIAFLFLTYNSAESAYRSRHDPPTLAFIVFAYVDLVMLLFCLKQFEKLSPESAPAKRERLKAAVWVLTVALNLAFAWRVAEIMPWLLSVLVWLMSVSVAIGGFYGLFIHQGSKDSVADGHGYSLVKNEELAPGDKYFINAVVIIVREAIENDNAEPTIKEIWLGPDMDEDYGVGVDEEVVDRPFHRLLAVLILVDRHHRRHPPGLTADVI